jgi:hypothetical protein
MVIMLAHPNSYFVITKIISATVDSWICISNCLMALPVLRRSVFLHVCGGGGATVYIHFHVSFQKILSFNN